MTSARSFTMTLTCGLLLLACGPTSGVTDGSSDSSEGCPVGAEGCPCPPSGDCDGGLQCRDGECMPAEASTTGDASSSSNGSTSAPDTSTGASGDTTTDGCEFICDTTTSCGDAPPGAELDPRCSPQCDPYAQDCPDGEKCNPWDTDGDGAWDQTVCVPVAGDGQHGEPCTLDPDNPALDDCDVGALCWHVDEEGHGTCVALCTGSAEDPSCPEGSFCPITGDGNNILCLLLCDPLEQDCGGDEVCIPAPNGDGFGCVLDASGGMAPAGTPCEFANACDPGLMCLSPDFFPGPDCQGSLGCCAPFCDVTGGDADCQGLPVPEAVCVNFYDGNEDPPPQYENVGVCGLPPP